MIAFDLIALYAKRQTMMGYAFPAPDEDYIEFAEAFPFEETPDQQQAIEAILEDLQSPRITDRLICGDVGFGKTEVAFRAAFLTRAILRFHGDSGRGDSGLQTWG